MSMNISQAYKLNKEISYIQDDISDTVHEINMTKLAYKAAFIATLILYFLFVWGIYVADMWGFTTWLVNNYSEIAALFVYGALSIVLPFTMAMIKEIGYKHFARYPNSKYLMFSIVGILALAGVIYEAITQSSQQQHIAYAAAENSKSFKGIDDTQIILGTGENSTQLAHYQGELAKYQQYAATCKKTCTYQKAKVAEYEAQVKALKDAQAINSQTQAVAQSNLFKARANEKQRLKEDAHKPVFKAVRDTFGISINAGIMLVTLTISVIFEISHLLLILFLSQKEKRLHYLKQSLTQLEANYLGLTGKSFNPDDFKDDAVLRPVAGDYYKKTANDFGFVPQTALFNQSRPTPPMGFDVQPAFKWHSKPAPRPEGSVSFGFIPSDPLPDTTSNTATIEPIKPCAQGTQGAKSTPVHMGSKLYNEWLAAVKAGEISPTATASRNFIQKRLAGKGSQSWRKTPTRSDFDLISKAFFVRATLDPKSGIVRNPKYAEHLRNGRMVTNGLPKYLLAEI